ncbi:hypothetical protein [Streptomyces abikoensis]|uniref:Uncharacterized protein n=1 Tax=Streptomyces abikoensis TaxID=97398 RepID=A0ABW7TD13_9ACTN
MHPFAWLSPVQAGLALLALLGCGRRRPQRFVVPLIGFMALMAVVFLTVLLLPKRR